MKKNLLIQSVFIYDQQRSTKRFYLTILTNLDTPDFSICVRERTLSMWEGRPEDFTNFSKNIS